MALSDDVSGGEAAPGQDLDRRQGIDAAGRVIDAARVALERGDETGAEDLLNAIKPPDGTIEASMAVLRSKIRDIRIARRQIERVVPGVSSLDGAPAAPESRDWGADTKAAREEVDEALVAWHFVEPPASVAAPAPKAGIESPLPVPEPLRFDASRPASLLFEPAAESTPTVSWMRWGGVLLVALVAAAAAYTYLSLR